MIRPGITTDALDEALVQASIERKCYPSPLGYHGYPKSVCTSVNEIICHGIPDQRPLEDGDIINLGTFTSIFTALRTIVLMRPCQMLHCTTTVCEEHGRRET